MTRRSKFVIQNEVSFKLIKSDECIEKKKNFEYTYVWHTNRQKRLEFQLNLVQIRTSSGITRNLDLV